MSLCRWSCMDWQCDLYVYEEGDKWNVFVAECRPQYHGPLPPLVRPADFDHFEDYIAAVLDRDKQVAQLLSQARMAKIGGPYDGCQWTGLSAKEAYEVCVELKKAGYRFPDDVLDALYTIYKDDLEKDESDIPIEELL